MPRKTKQNDITSPEENLVCGGALYKTSELFRQINQVQAARMAA